jgi:hypothetical protein
MSVLYEGILRCSEFCEILCEFSNAQILSNAEITVMALTERDISSIPVIQYSLSKFEIMAADQETFIYIQVPKYHRAKNFEVFGFTILCTHVMRVGP